MKSPKNLLKKINAGVKLSPEESDVVRAEYFPFDSGDEIKYIGQSPKLKNGEMYIVDDLYFTKLVKGKKDPKWFDEPEVLVRLRDIEGSFPVYWFIDTSKPSYSISLPASTKEVTEEELVRLMNDAAGREDYDEAILFRTMLEKLKPKELSIEELNLLMENAISEEDYETAAKVRDRINKL